ncbi:MAG: acetyltransferase, partial [Clostridiales bacterium]|nr:acetyltransferase [Clostridiales bacterium]
SLAIEGQFYLLWPIALGLAFRFFKRKRVIALTAAAAIASAVAMIALYVPGSDPSRVYYGTDTRMFALLIGALAAMVSSRRRLPESLPFKKQLLLEVAGASGLIVVLLIMFKTNQYYSFTYQGGLLLFSAAAACLVAAIAHPASALGSLLEARPLKWIGECSYGIYLWHFPVILLTSPAVNTSGPTLSLSLIQIATTFALAAMSRYLVEDPVRYGVPIAPAVIFSRHRKRHGITSRAAVRISAIAFMVLLMPLAAAEESGQLFAFDHPDWAVETELAAGSPLAAKTAEAAAAAGTSETSETEPLPVSALAAETEPAAELTTETEPFPTYTEAGETEPAAELTPAAEGAGYEITVIGDSLMVGVKPYLEALVPGITVDAKKSRQMRQAQDLILDMKKAGNLKSTVVIELGTNGPFTENQLIDVLDSLENVEKVIFINARVPRHWETAVNETLEKVLAPYRNAVLIDWYSESSGHDEYFYDDGVHLRPVGAEAYCSMITDALWPVV